MRLTCEHCQRSFNLPEDKVPQTRRFRFTCPVCRETNQIQLQEQDEEMKEPAAGDEVTLDPPPVHVPPGARLALAFVTDEQALGRVRSCLQNRGWQVVQASTPRMGRAYVQTYRLELVVLEDSEQGREVLAEVHRLSGRERREMNCVLVGDRTASFDTLTAFVLGINSYVRQDDPQGLEAGLDQAQEFFDQHRQMWLAAADT